MRDDAYIPLFAGVLARGLGEGEQLALALKASMDTALEERTPRLVSLLFVSGPKFSHSLKSFPVLLSRIILISNTFTIFL